MGEYVDEEGQAYRTDQAGRVLAIRTNHPQELADGLETLARELPRTREDLHAWKWAIIAGHNAAQNILADCAAGDRSRSRKEIRKLGNRVLGARDAHERQRWLDALMSKTWELLGRGEELQDLQRFLDLYDTVNRKWRLSPPEGLRTQMEMLNDARNAFIHFGAGSYEFDVGQYPTLLLDCLSWVEHLGWKTALVLWFNDDSKDRARAALEVCIGTLKDLQAEYS